MVAGAKNPTAKCFAQMVVATAMSAEPAEPSDLPKKVVEEVQVSCAGLCGTGEACVYADPAVKDRQRRSAKDRIDLHAKLQERARLRRCQVCRRARYATERPAARHRSVARLVRTKTAASLVFYNRATGALKMATGTDWKVTTLDGGDGKSTPDAMLVPLRPAMEPCTLPTAMPTDGCFTKTPKAR